MDLSEQYDKIYRYCYFKVHHCQTAEAVSYTHLACGCPWMAERIEAGVVGYAEVVRQMFPHEKRLMARLEPLIRDFPGMLWKDERHRQRMEGVKIHLGHSKRRDTPCLLYTSPVISRITEKKAS